MRKNKLTVQTEWKKRIRKYRIRIVLCGGLILSAYLIPQLTQAQYKWTLNGYSTLQAKSYYFASDKLRDEASNMRYPISGWDGKGLNFTLEIRNYENALLANAEGENAEYNLTWDIQTNRKNSSGDPYTLALVSHITADTDAGTINENNTFHSKIIGTGTPKKDSYTFRINPSSESQILQEGDYVTITITAENAASDNSYSKNLKATFIYRVSRMDSYVNKFDFVEGENNDNVKLSLGTGTLPDLDAKRQTIVVWWDPSKLQVNTFNYVFMNTNAAGGYKQVTVNERNFEILELTDLGSNVLRELDYRKVGGVTDKWFTSADNTVNDQHVNKGATLDQVTADQYIGYYIQANTNAEGQK